MSSENKMYGIKLAIIKLILTRFTRILRMVKVVFNKIDIYIDIYYNIDIFYISKLKTVATILLQRFSLQPTNPLPSGRYNVISYIPISTWI